MKELFITSVEFFCELKNLKALKNKIYNKMDDNIYYQES